MSSGDAPKLAGQAADAVSHRGGHMQIIACAGSGKTEVVAQRIASLIGEGVPPNEIVAFTFTEMAAAELKERISKRVMQRYGQAVADGIGSMYVGTIHAFALALLQRYVPKYETYDALDANQQAAFLHREANRIGLRGLRSDGKLFAAIDDFVRACDVIENELIDPSTLPVSLRLVYQDYVSALNQYRLLTFGQMIVGAVHQLATPTVQSQLVGQVRYLVVDEYQDVNPAQEELIRLIVASGAELCVVGDDDQAIYQWRGSSIEGVLTFKSRYPGSRSFDLLTNFRSHESIIDLANAVTESIEPRIPKAMKPSSVGTDRDAVEIHELQTELDEVRFIAAEIVSLRHQGVPYSDIAILCRKRAAFPAILDALDAAGIPVQASGASGLFDSPEADAMGRLFSWLVDGSWASGRFGTWSAISLPDLIARFKDVFTLDDRSGEELEALVLGWKENVSVSETVNLVDRYYTLLATLGIRDWDTGDPRSLSRLGTLGRFSQVIVDYEQVRRRSRPDRHSPHEQVGGEFGGEWYFRNFASYLAYFARTSYEGFATSADAAGDAVNLLTVHGAKGLEWPVVFVPSLTSRRFDFEGNVTRHPTLVPDDLYDAARYAGTDSDERRLFYVAVTRARDLLVLSSHRRTQRAAVRPSAYLELARRNVAPPTGRRHVDPRSTHDAPVRLTFSELDSYFTCGRLFLYRSVLGFAAQLAPELGYGKAIHNMMRRAAVRTMGEGKPLEPSSAAEIVSEDFYLPSANKAAHMTMMAAAERLLHNYLSDPDLSAELTRTWETERPFTLNLEGVTVDGRADIIFTADGMDQDLVIVDYKTASGREDHSLQVGVYAAAAAKEGLPVCSGKIVDLKTTTVTSVDVTPSQLSDLETRILDAAISLRAGHFPATTDAKVCGRCDFRTICPSSLAV